MVNKFHQNQKSKILRQINSEKLLFKMGNDNHQKIINGKYRQLNVVESQWMSFLTYVEQISTKEKYMVKQLNFGHEFQFEKMTKTFKQREYLSKKKAGQHIIKLKEFQTIENSQICGKNLKICLYLEALETTLKDVYNEKIRCGNKFNEQEILSIVRSLVSNLLVMNDYNIKNFHIYKETIFVGKAQNYKLIDKQLSSKNNPFNEIMNGIPVRSGTYLAPELLAEIKKDNMDVLNTPKSDIFTLGMIVLELCRLENFDTLYNFQHKIINLSLMDEKIQGIQYSKFLKNILKCMLRAEEDERIGLVSLKQMLTNDVQCQTIQSISSRSFIQENQQKQNNLTNRLPISPFQQRIQSTKDNPSSYSQRTDFHHFENRNFDSPYVTQKQIKRDSSQYIQSRSNMQKKYSPFSQTNSLTNRNRNQNQVLQQNNVVVKMNNKVKDIIPKVLEIEPQEPQVKDFTFPNVFQSNLSTPIRKVEQLQSANRFFQKSQQKVQIKQERLSFHKKGKPQAINVPQSTNCQQFNNRTYGKHIFNNGSCFEGEFNEKKEFDGNGMLFYPDGKLCYSGSWKDNNFHGFGIIHNDKPETGDSLETNYENFNENNQNNWSHYEGEFSMDKKEGFGTLYMLNGDKFSGCFKNDSIEGFGTFYSKNSKKTVNGIWINNILRK